MRNILFALLLIACSTYGENAPPVSASTDAIINLPLTETWNLFSTQRGLNDIGYQQVTISLVLNGHLHAELNSATGTETIDGALLSFDPQHMMSWQWTDKHCWSVLYFNQMGAEMTQIRWVDFCADEQTAMLTQASTTHRKLFDQLIRRYAPECHVCKEEREAAEKQSR